MRTSRRGKFTHECVAGMMIITFSRYENQTLPLTLSRYLSYGLDIASICNSRNKKGFYFYGDRGILCRVTEAGNAYALVGRSI